MCALSPPPSALLCVVGWFTDVLLYFFRRIDGTAISGVGPLFFLSQLQAVVP
jgi:hypothetical protein